MRTRNVLILIVLALGLMSEALVGKKEVAAELSVRQQFDSELHNLKKNIAFAAKKNPSEVWEVIEKTEQEIEALRSASPRQFETDEIYMDLVLAGLEMIPRGSEFEKEKCPDYQIQIFAHFDPQGSESEDQPSRPMSQALSVLSALCKIKK